MTRITLYSKERCVQCTASKLALLKAGVDFKNDGDVIELGDKTFVHDDATTEENLAFVKGLGYMQAPVMTVMVDGDIVDHWSGFRPDKITEYAAA